MQKFELQVDARNLRVDIGMPVHFPYVAFPTTASLFDTAKFCEKHGVKTRLVSPVGCSLVTDARSAVVDEFLKGDATHLFWIDSDIHWHPHSFARLLTFSTTKEVPVVGATYPLKKDPIQLIVGELGEQGPYGLIDISGLGLGFTVMRREVVEAVAAGKPMIETNGGKVPMREVFRLDRTADGKRIGEDIGFFNDIRAAGYKVWLDPMVNVAHVGMKLYQADVKEVIAGPNGYEFFDVEHKPS